ncbi:hypothetical protein ACIXNM_21230 [Bacteroides fragilis]
MNKKKVLCQAANKSVKNAIREIQQSTTEIVKEARGRKAGAQIPGIISNNEGVIKALIESYILDAKEQNIKTCKDSLARYIEEKKLFGKIRNGVFKPLVLSTIRTYVNEIWNKMERKKKNQEGKR